MTEQVEPAGERVNTGVVAVDAVVAEVEGLEGRDLDEHIEVFTRAHDQLRGVLDAPDEHA